MKRGVATVIRLPSNRTAFAPCLLQPTHLPCFQPAAHVSRRCPLPPHAPSLDSRSKSLHARRYAVKSRLRPATLGLISPSSHLPLQHVEPSARAGGLCDHVGRPLFGGLRVSVLQHRFHPSVPRLNLSETASYGSGAQAGGTELICQYVRLAREVSVLFLDPGLTRARDL